MKHNRDWPREVPPINSYWLNLADWMESEMREAEQERARKLQQEQMNLLTERMRNPK